jgi:hypothetical protein
VDVHRLLEPAIQIARARNENTILTSAATSLSRSSKLKRRLKTVLGWGILGLLAAGLVAPIAAVLLPSAWQGERTLCATAVALVGVAITTGWLLSTRKKQTTG